MRTANGEQLPTPRVESVHVSGGAGRRDKVLRSWGSQLWGDGRFGCGELCVRGKGNPGARARGRGFSPKFFH